MNVYSNTQAGMLKTMSDIFLYLWTSDVINPIENCELQPFRNEEARILVSGYCKAAEEKTRLSLLVFKNKTSLIIKICI